MKTKSLNHISQLDGLRGIAVLLVCIAHFYQVDEFALYESSKILGVISFKLSQIGLRGVDLFFILSGYLITRILLNTKDSTNYFSSFYARRFFRIFPLYYLVLFLSFFILPNYININSENQQIIEHQWKLCAYTSNMFFIYPVSWDIQSFPNFGHFWSLAVEEHFYIFWPFIVYFANKNIKLFMWSLFYLSLICWILGFFIPFFNWTTLKYSSVLSIGGLIAYYELYEYQTIKSYFDKIKKYLFYFFILLILSSFLPRSLDKYGDFIMFIISLYFFSNLVIVTIFAKNENTFFSNNILIFFGKISYGIYVYHGLLRPYFKVWFYEPLLINTKDGIMASLLYTVIATVLSIVIAYLSWELFEKHTIKLKKYFKYEKKEKNV